MIVISFVIFLSLVLRLLAGGNGDSWGAQRARDKAHDNLRFSNDEAASDSKSSFNSIEYHQKQQQQQPQKQLSTLDGIHVGKTGAAVTHAKETSIAPVIKTKPQVDWNELATTKCIDQGFPAAIRPEDLPGSMLPTAIVMGDTRVLYDYLNQHPEIAPTSPDLSYLDEKVDAWILKSRQGIPRKNARVGYTKAMNRAILDPADKEPRARNFLIDWTSNYLFHSDKTPARVHCIVSWVKLIGILQDPIDRALAQYERTEFLVEGLRSPPSFEDYILADIAALQEIGVLQDWSVVDFDEFAGSTLERKAWRTYINSGLPSPVGRGLYSLMLRHFLNEMPETEFLILQTEDLTGNIDESQAIIMEYLGLRKMRLREKPVDDTEDRRHFLTKDIAYIMRQVFEPYNRHLEKLLGEQWKGVWAKQ